ncbi:hypothetical protein SMD11_1247 [Streptomyces albireticuli]|uniref:Uncharacterized protein n=1 Tax=Streptomyces albireticuli TaxID=1940 RepID=A0A1Z2KXY6_9ACTN|nr:hypothetical protein [Streptomyces albireticuli]ARZ66908.1 hypothetical protein SMD11_1247 [Streptomyces albireticuli]
MPKTKLEMFDGWEYDVFRSADTRKAVAHHAAEITAYAVSEAPHDPEAKSHWNEIRKHIRAHLVLDAAGWGAHVSVEVDPRVRHAMLQERGWRDRKGRRHAGRRFLKAALLKARVQ